MPEEAQHSFPLTPETAETMPDGARNHRRFLRVEEQIIIGKTQSDNHGELANDLELPRPVDPTTDADAGTVIRDGQEIIFGSFSDRLGLGDDKDKRRRTGEVAKKLLGPDWDISTNADYPLSSSE